MKQSLKEWWAGLKPMTRQIALVMIGFVMMTFIICLTITNDLGNLLKLFGS